MLFMLFVMYNFKFFYMGNFLHAGGKYFIYIELFNALVTVWSYSKFLRLKYIYEYCLY